MKDNYEILERLNRLDMLLKRYYGHGHKGHGYAHRGQGRVLKILKEQSQMSQKELCEVLDMRKQSLGELIQKLETKELIERMPSENDKRVMNVRLTEKGHEIAENMGREKQRRENIFSILTEEELAVFTVSVDKLINNLENKEDVTEHRKHHHSHGCGRGKHEKHRDDEQ